MFKKRIISLFAVVAILLSIAMSINSVIPIKADSNSQYPPTTVVSISSGPPANFDPLSASAEQLKAYDFPPKPNDTTALKSWENAMSHAKVWVKPQITYDPEFRHDTWDNPNYAGIAVQSQFNSGYLYTASATTWVMPYYYKGYHTGEVAAYWTGIGGADVVNGINYSHKIVQAGADANLSFTGHSPNYEFWVEDFPNSTTWLDSPYISPGDSLYVYVAYGGSTSQAWLEDITSGNVAQIYFSSPIYDGLSADFIFEKVDTSPYPGSFDNIPNVPFTNCYLWSGMNNGYFNSYNYTNARQQNGYFQIKAYPDTIGTGSFTMHAHN